MAFLSMEENKGKDKYDTDRLNMFKVSGKDLAQSQFHASFSHWKKNTFESTMFFVRVFQCAENW